MTDNLYSNGLPFTDGVKENLEDFDAKVKNKTGALIVIDGGLGQGKTTFMIECMDYINKINGLPPIDLKGCQFSMGGLEFEDNIEKCFKQGLPCIGYDEAGDFNRRGALSKINSLLNRVFQTVRAYNCVVFIVLPCFLVLDMDLYTNDIVQGLFHLHNKQQGKYGDFKLYDMHTMLYMKKIAKDHSNPMMCYNKVIPNMQGHFKDLGEERSKLLDEIGMAKKRQLKNKARIAYEGLLTYFDISNKVGKSMDWCRRLASELKIKPVKEVNKVKYFHADSLNLFIDHIDMLRENETRGRKPKAINEEM